MPLVQKHRTDQAPCAGAAEPRALGWGWSSPCVHPIPSSNVCHLSCFPLSQKDLENLKAEVQRRQQLQESIKGSEQLDPEDKAVEEKEAEPRMPPAAIPLTQSSA